MSGRKNSLLQYHNIVSGAMNQTITSSVTNIQFLDNVGIQFNFTGTPTGNFAVQVSADYNQDPGGTVLNSGNWVDLTLSPGPTAAGVANVIYLDLNQLSAPWIRSKYTPTGAGVQTIGTVADVSKSLASKYFLLESGGSSPNKYAVWFKVSGTGSGPSVSGYTNEEVDISTNATAAQVGTALALVIAALNSSGDFTATGTTTVTVTNLTTGPFVPIVQGVASTGFTFTTTAGSGVLNGYITAKML